MMVFILWEYAILAKLSNISTIPHPKPGCQANLQTKWQLRRAYHKVSNTSFRRKPKERL